MQGFIFYGRITPLWSAVSIAAFSVSVALIPDKSALENIVNPWKAEITSVFMQLYPTV
jgi:hypothetical protein